jgi:hypothetical protein
VKKLLDRPIVQKCQECQRYLSAANDKPDERTTMLTRTLNKGRLAFASDGFSHLILAAELFFQALSKTKAGTCRFAQFTTPEKDLAAAFMGETDFKSGAGELFVIFHCSA